MAHYAFYFDGKRCTGCKTCEMACKDYKDLSKDVAYRKIYEYAGGGWTVGPDGCYRSDVFTYFVSVACNHCSDPACTKACPTGAMHQDSDTGLVSVDTTRCIGCGYCAMACPYNAPKVDRALGHSVKCDGCKDRVAQGKQPICVEACPLRALDFGTISDMAAKGEQADIAPLPRKALTSPNLYVKASAAAQPSDANDGVRSASGAIMNPLEVR